MANYLVCVLFLAFASTIDANLQTVNGKVKIFLSTTSGCGDTVNFITQQLGPVYRQYGRHLEVEFVPWGRTQRTPNGLQCQFGTDDCFANRLHRCALNLLPTNEAQVNYMLCEFSSPYPAYLQGSYACVTNAGLRVEDVNNCLLNDADRLEFEAEAKAAEPMRIINFVPAIVFNDNIDVALHQQARFSLASMVCGALSADPSTGVTC